MQCYPNQLEMQLRKGLAPLYLVSGDEPLQAGEAADAVRAATRSAGFEERLVFHAEAGFDPAELSAAADALSLFATQRLMELRLGGMPNKGVAEALEAYAGHPPQDTVLLITAPKIDAKSKKSKWYQAVDRAGVCVSVWPVEVGQLPGWIEKRLRSRGLRAVGDAPGMLVERVEGNLLAAAQEIDKLALLLGEGGQVDEEVVRETVGSSSRFDVYDLSEAALEGDFPRVRRILEGLQGEGSAPYLVLWALHREASRLAAMADEVAGGASAETVLGRYRIWDKQKPRLRQALQRAKPAAMRRLLQTCARSEQVIKGGRVGDPWQALLEVCIHLGGAEDAWLAAGGLN